jgi:hypothetical protein
LPNGPARPRDDFGDNSDIRLVFLTTETRPDVSLSLFFPRKRFFKQASGRIVVRTSAGRRLCDGLAATAGASIAANGVRRRIVKK